MQTLSLKQARKLALLCQGLARSNAFGKGKAGTLQTIRQLGYVQIDTISVVERAHKHTLWSRCSTASQKHLDALQVRDRQVFEYWSHAAAYLPIEDYRFCLPRMQQFATGEQRWWFKLDKKVMQYVLDRIRNEGPLMARDFKPPEGHKSGPWWDWKPAKIALENLFQQGALLISHRNQFHKVYDLPERILPGQIETGFPTPQEFCRFLTHRALQAHGFATEQEIGYLRKGIKADLKTTLKKMLAEGEIIEVTIQGLAGHYLTTPAALKRLDGGRLQRNVHILSPFDNLVIQRKRVQQLFGFDYQIECYVPPPKRKFGYYCLPVIWGDQFVARMDSKADRQRRVFIIRNLIFEPGFRRFDVVLPAFADKLRQLADFNGCPEIEVERVSPTTFRDALQAALR